MFMQQVCTDIARKFRFTKFSIKKDVRTHNLMKLNNLGLLVIYAISKSLTLAVRYTIHT